MRTRCVMSPSLLYIRYPATRKIAFIPDFLLTFALRGLRHRSRVLPPSDRHHHPQHPDLHHRPGHHQQGEEESECLPPLPSCESLSDWSQDPQCVHSEAGPGAY